MALERERASYSSPGMPSKQRSVRRRTRDDDDEVGGRRGSSERRSDPPPRPRIIFPSNGPPIELPPENAPLPKSPLKKTQFKHFRMLLLTKRAEVFGSVMHMTNDSVGGYNSARASESSNIPLHMADVGTENWEQEVTLGLAASEANLVREIDSALARIEAGTYGVCIATHRPIGLARLEAKPWARHCIEYARLRDEGRVPR